MLKKLVPVVLMVFLSACGNTPSTTMGMMPCCEKCENCKSGDCSECCKDGQCTGCKGMTAKQGDENCPACAKAEREWKAKHPQAPVKR